MATDDVFVDESGDRERVGFQKSASFDPAAEIVPCEHNELVSFHRGRHVNNIYAHLFPDYC